MYNVHTCITFVHSIIIEFLRVCTWSEVVKYPPIYIKETIMVIWVSSHHMIIPITCTSCFTKIIHFQDYSNQHSAGPANKLEVCLCRLHNPNRVARSSNTECIELSSTSFNDITNLKRIAFWKWSTVWGNVYDIVYMYYLSICNT